MPPRRLEGKCEGCNYEGTAQSLASSRAEVRVRLLPQTKTYLLHTVARKLKIDVIDHCKVATFSPFHVWVTILTIVSIISAFHNYV